ncbi:MAG: hypothetical protein LBI72_10270 [Flavobacteriaceae bacterium]|jgi:hypothetical protein|nr:hypothetical protein [Flavobacteriaceae bacterium]
MVSKQTIQYSTRTSILFVLMFFVFGCASYHDRITDYYQKIGDTNYEEANKALDKNKLIQKPRNQLLFNMEKGKVTHLMGQYKESNDYLNKADELVEEGLKSTGDVAVGLFLNSMSQNYKGEEFELFMIHYYKALNYLYLGNSEEAIVEARRITLQNYAQGDKYNEKSSRYSKDAFSFIMQGLIYEQSGDYNNAFIAYRNAVEVYQEATGGMYYGVSMPEHLKYDVMRMAYKMGFSSELQTYERQFKTKFKDYKPTDGGELVLFWENGRAPIKEQENLLFTLVKGEDGALVFTNALGIMIPLDFGLAGKTTLNDVHSVNVAYPKYIVQKPPYVTAKVGVNGEKNFAFEKVEDIDALAVLTLKERAGREMSQILTRLAVKKAAEYSLKAAAKSNGSNGENNAVLEGLGLGVQLYSLFSEKADTRNWQTLPATISYVRIPLVKGKNQVTVELERGSGQRIEHKIEVDGSGKMQFHNFATMK